MTREEAVEVLENGGFWDYMAKLSCNTDAVKKFHAALDMAIAALSAGQTPAKLDRSRWKGCRTCNCQNSVFRNWGSYCPSCGLPFTEEAWAELERRVNGGTADDARCGR